MTPDQMSYLKLYMWPILAALFGATAHALDKVKRFGWKGWFDFSSDIIVCSFIGFTFYHLALLYAPNMAVFACSIGSYLGTKGFVIVKDAFIRSVKANFK